MPTGAVDRCNEPAGLTAFGREQRASLALEIARDEGLLR
ncbi:hypothetical protein BTH_II0915 [Burkholderia thailandensis E264]|uniref:Uncharacterized protein n=1 Tax=Burkholderia thailandensis (strain ATCC 700388 / DSM 13276 / CCUG 48851 / CIP 106301 / E264) TaxID=271848 RepID=Q2T6T7_BURTA|nr:hypothetical protein BTH_II0915 [Burkholderia thailandensis E264]